jgi:hypothetical protein
MTLKEYITKEDKLEVYNFYRRLKEKPKDYESISRLEMYNEIINTYKEDPEVILKLLTSEEIHCLKSLVNEKEVHDNYGYLEYVVVTNLKTNYLILKENNNYYIPKDIINYVKMALNMFDEKSYSFKDVTDSVLLGLSRIYNVVLLEDFINLLAKQYINMVPKDLKKYIEANPKICDKISVIKYQKQEYVISLEHYYYKDILSLRKNYYKYNDYSLESVISIGKYKLNLFKEEVFNFLNFLECHLEPKYIELIVNDLVVYCGFDIRDEETLNNIADNIADLIVEIKKALCYFPIWIYKGNTSKTLKENTILPDKNDLCLCGSGKKFKHCCRKDFK